MTINLSDNNPRVVYTVGGTPQTDFIVTFSFFASSDLNVYVDGVLQTLGSDYQLSGDNADESPIVFYTAVSNVEVAITRDVPLERTTDFSAGAAVNGPALNDQLDRITAQIADIDDKASRTIHLDDWADAATLTIPSLDDRKGKGLQFNETTGDVEVATLLTGASASSSDLAEGESATASVTVTDGVAAFSFGIPAGAAGPQGATGPQGPQGDAGVAGADGVDGADGLGFTGGSYNASTGVVTFTSDDGLGFSTGDLRGADGADGTGDLVSTNNLSDLANAATARTNLGLGSAATTASTDYAAASHTHVIADITDFIDLSLYWNDAYGWGDHSLQGYLTSIADGSITEAKLDALNAATDGYVLSYDSASGQLEWIAVGGTGTVTSVAATVPTGFTVSGSPITSSGTLAVSYDTGYQGYTSAEATKLAGIEAGATADQTASEILTAIKTVDGATSGLDADLLDGQHGSYYLDYNNFTNTPSIPSAYTNSDVDAHLNTGTAATGEVLSWNGADYDWVAVGGSGTVTSVAATVPTGFSISGSPVTTSGTLAISYAAGYQGYTTTEASKLSGIEAAADVTDTANVTAAGALMDSELTDLAGVKALDTSTLATLTGSQTLTNKTLTDPSITGTIVEDIYALTDGTTVNIDPSNGSIQTLTLTGTGRTLTFTNMVNGEAITLMVNDGTDGTITTWNATFVNGSGAPTLSTTGYTVVAIWKVGGTVYAATVGSD